MSYIVREEHRRPGARGPLPAVVIGVVGAVVAVLAGLLVWSATAEDPERPQVSWAVVGSQPVPLSQRHGPFRTGDGLASGFSHDELGAALAATHISARLVPTVPAAVYQATARAQCYGADGAGDGAVAAYVEWLARSVRGRPAASPAEVGRELYYRVVDGDPRGGEVQISLAAVTDEARGQGGYAELRRTLRWVDGDWKMQLPPPPRAIVDSLSGYLPLEPDHG